MTTRLRRLSPGCDGLCNSMASLACSLSADATLVAKLAAALGDVSNLEQTEIRLIAYVEGLRAAFPPPPPLL